MSAGDDFRKITERDDALALLAITEIMDERRRKRAPVACEQRYTTTSLYS